MLQLFLIKLFYNEKKINNIYTLYIIYIDARIMLHNKKKFELRVFL